MLFKVETKVHGNRTVHVCPPAFRLFILQLLCLKEPVQGARRYITEGVHNGNADEHGEQDMVVVQEKALDAAACSHVATPIY